MTSEPEPAAAVLGRVLLDQEFVESDLRSLRHAAAAHADHLGSDPGRIATLELIVSELASNAIRHGGGRGRIRMWAASDEIVCEVSDQGSGLSALPERDPRPEPTRSGGRGLWLIITYADSVELRSATGGGTVITATVRVQPPPTT